MIQIGRAPRGAPSQHIRVAAIDDGMATLYRDGVEKVLNGVTTMEEVFRVAKRGNEDMDMDV